MPTNVLIAGGGPAALEAALALHRLAGERVVTTLLAPESNLIYRPLSVPSAFDAGFAPVYPLEQMAADAGFTHVHGRLARVDATAHTVTTLVGEHLSYDVLLVAVGARPVEPFSRAAGFAGSLADQQRLHAIVQDFDEGFARRIAFVVPAGSSWPLPLYELALMFAERAAARGIDAELHVITHEPAPLALFGAAAANEVAGLLAEAQIILHAASDAKIAEPGRIQLTPGGETLEVERVVALPRLHGPSIPGLPADANDFLVTDAHSRVQGVRDVYAAGDVTAFEVKQGGIACQQADAAAEDIAARAGAAVDPEPFRPVLRGVLTTQRSARYLRREAGGAAEVTGHALWWPPTRIAGRELAAYLERLDETAGRPSGRPIDIDVRSGAIEDLGLRS